METQQIHLDHWDLLARWLQFNSNAFQLAVFSSTGWLAGWLMIDEMPTFAGGSRTQPGKDLRDVHFAWRQTNTASLTIHPSIYLFIKLAGWLDSFRGLSVFGFGCKREMGWCCCCYCCCCVFDSVLILCKCM